mgnify:CR=1 FL=1
MKKYILKLIDQDIAKQKLILESAEQIILQSLTQEYYWELRKKAQMKKISLALKYRDKILNLQ